MANKIKIITDRIKFTQKHRIISKDRKTPIEAAKATSYLKKVQQEERS